MVFLGFGKYARADKIYALEPIRGEDRGGGKRTLVWVDGISEPIIASRTERTILHEMGQDVAAGSRLLDEALAFAERIAEDADKGRVDLGDLGRRARKLLEASAKPASPPINTRGDGVSRVTTAASSMLTTEASENTTESRPLTRYSAP